KVAQDGTGKSGEYLDVVIESQVVDEASQESLAQEREETIEYFTYVKDKATLSTEQVSNADYFLRNSSNLQVVVSQQKVSDVVTVALQSSDPQAFEKALEKINLTGEELQTAKDTYNREV